MDTKERYNMINTLKSYKKAKLLTTDIFVYKVNFNIDEELFNALYG